jgi:hypothetical protein
MIASQRIHEPLYEIVQPLKTLINNIGMDSIKDIITLYISYKIYGENNNNNKLIDFYDKIFFPISISEVKIVEREKIQDNFDLSTQDIFVRKNKGSKDDLVDNVFDLYIYNITYYIVIKGNFINDDINIYFKTSQITNFGLYNKRKHIESIIIEAPPMPTNKCICTLFFENTKLKIVDNNEKRFLI